MAPQRTFSYEFLKQLVSEHPDWDYHQYARALTEERRQALNDPTHPVILPNTVVAAVARHRDQWLSEGIQVPDRRLPVYSDLIPWRNIPEQARMHTHLRKLRLLARIRRGYSVPPREARLALRFERTLRERRQVVDLGPEGSPLVRQARPDELDDEGNLIEIVGTTQRGGISEQYLRNRLQATERELATLREHLNERDKRATGG